VADASTAGGQHIGCSTEQVLTCDLRLRSFWLYLSLQMQMMGMRLILMVWIRSATPPRSPPAHGSSSSRHRHGQSMAQHALNTNQERANSLFPDLDGNVTCWYQHNHLDDHAWFTSSGT
jgi:hypothetical protein